MQAVQAQEAALQSTLDEAQAAADTASRRAESAATAAAALSPALTPEDLADPSMVQGRLAELAAAQSLAAAAAAAEPAPAATQRSDVEGGGRAARFGNPTHPQTAAVKRALALQRRGVHGAFAQLGSVQDTRLSELLSASLQATLRTLVVDDTETRCAPHHLPPVLEQPCVTAHFILQGAPAGGLHGSPQAPVFRRCYHSCSPAYLHPVPADSTNLPTDVRPTSKASLEQFRALRAHSTLSTQARPRISARTRHLCETSCCTSTRIPCRIAVTEALLAEQCQVPDVLALPMCSRCSAAAESPHARCALDDLPQPARGLIQAACHGSERPLLVPLPHTQGLARLQKARRPIPQVRAPPAVATLSAFAVRVVHLGVSTVPPFGGIHCCVAKGNCTHWDHRPERRFPMHSPAPRRRSAARCALSQRGHLHMRAAWTTAITLTTESRL